MSPSPRHSVSIGRTYDNLRAAQVDSPALLLSRADRPERGGVEGTEEGREKKSETTTSGRMRVLAAIVSLVMLAGCPVSIIAPPTAAQLEILEEDQA